jgi:hypothetical protein
MSTAVAYCYRNGLIRIDIACPQDAVAIARGTPVNLLSTLCTRAPETFAGGQWQVPGLDIEVSPDTAKALISKFRARLCEGNATIEPCQPEGEPA